jgi:hypothetical protein
MKTNAQSLMILLFFIAFSYCYFFYRNLELTIVVLLITIFTVIVFNYFLPQLLLHTVTTVNSKLYTNRHFVNALAASISSAICAETFILFHNEYPLQIPGFAIALEYLFYIIIFVLFSCPILNYKFKEAENKIQALKPSSVNILLCEKVIIKQFGQRLIGCLTLTDSRLIFTAQQRTAENFDFDLRATQPCIDFIEFMGMRQGLIIDNNYKLYLNCPYLWYEKINDVIEGRKY